MEEKKPHNNLSLFSAYVMLLPAVTAEGLDWTATNPCSTFQMVRTSITTSFQIALMLGADWLPCAEV